MEVARLMATFQVLKRCVCTAKAVRGEGSCPREASEAELKFLDGPLQELLLLVAVVKEFFGQHLSLGVNASGLSNQCANASVWQTSCFRMVGRQQGEPHVRLLSLSANLRDGYDVQALRPIPFLSIHMCTLRTRGLHP